MLSLRGWNWLLWGNVVGMVHSAVLPLPAITPAPRPAQVDVRSLQNRQDPDALEVLEALLTALPLSLRQIAATNIPAVSSILWSEFLDGNRPQWFNDLPYDVQSYFISEFGPATAAPPVTALPSDVTASATEQPTETSASQASDAASSASESLPTSMAESSTLPGSESLSTFPTPTASSSSFSSETSASSSTSSSASSTTLATSSSTSRPSTRTLSPYSSASADPEAPAPADPGLSTRQKLGIGIGVPIALVAIAALLLACCLLMRRRKRRSINGSQPPSSPGFIPRFSFQDRSWSSEHNEHRAPLNPGSRQQSRFVEDTNWDDDGYDPTSMATAYQGHTLPSAGPAPASWLHQGNALPQAAAPMAMQDNHTPIIAPALYHSHSSNRARGRRTSHTSLHSVAEVTEPDDSMTGESPILGRRNSPPKTGPRRPGVSTLDTLPVPEAMAPVRRKPVPSSPAAEASRHLLRPSLTHNTTPHSDSSASSNIAISSLSSNSGRAYHSDDSAPISPITQQQATNPFAGGYSYLEDYGPEYSISGYNHDQDDETYGGHRSLDRYPEPEPPRRGGSKTEWPLKSMLSGGGQKRTRSPMWDRVYERV